MLQQVFSAALIIGFIGCQQSKLTKESTEKPRSDSETVNSVSLKGKTIDDQSFDVEWKEFGKTRFVSTSEDTKSALLSYEK